jgi:hypothetical protein
VREIKRGKEGKKRTSLNKSTLLCVILEPFFCNNAMSSTIFDAFFDSFMFVRRERNTDARSARKMKIKRLLICVRRV